MKSVGISRISQKRPFSCFPRFSPLINRFSAFFLVEAQYKIKTKFDRKAIKIEKSSKISTFQGTVKWKRKAIFVKCFTFYIYIITHNVRPAGGVKRNTFPLNNLHFLFELQVQIVTKIGPIYFPLTENKTTSNGSTFRQKLTSKEVTFLSKSDRLPPSTPKVLRLVDVIRSDNSNCRIVTPNYMIDSH